MALKLKRVEAGHYRTLDGRYDVIKDPTSGGVPGGWGYVSWLIYEKDADEPSWSGGTYTFASKRLAVVALEALLAEG